MNLKHFYKAALSVSVIFIASCSAKHYEIVSILHERHTIDARYDALPDTKATEFITPFKSKVDSIMSPVVGRAAYAMESNRPESKLSNLLADILVWAGEDYNEKPVFSVYNIGGIRSTFSQGDITVGDVIDVAPFENKICFMTLRGSDVKALFEQIAVRGGEGVSHSVRSVISKDGKLLSLTINGEEVVNELDYRIATIDYLAEGNDGMPAFKNGKDRNMPKADSNNLRNVIINYLQHLSKDGKEVTSVIEGRIVVNK